MVVSEGEEGEVMGGGFCRCGVARHGSGDEREMRQMLAVPTEGDPFIVEDDEDGYGEANDSCIEPCKYQQGMEGFV